MTVPNIEGVEGWPKSLEELRESARLWNIDVAAETRAELAAMGPPPSYIIGSADGITMFGSLEPSLNESLEEELGGIFDEREAANRASRNQELADLLEALKKIL